MSVFYCLVPNASTEITGIVDVACLFNESSHITLLDIVAAHLPQPHTETSEDIPG